MKPDFFRDWFFKDENGPKMDRSNAVHFQAKPCYLVDQSSPTQFQTHPRLSLKENKRIHKDLEVGFQTWVYIHQNQESTVYD